MVAAPYANGEIAIYDIARMPEYRAVAISPTGAYLAVTRHHKAQDYLLILDTGSMSLHYSASFGDSEISNVWWVNNDRVVLQAGYRLPGISDTDRDSEVFGMNADGSRRKRLIRFLDEDMALLSVLPQQRKKILVEQRPSPFSTDVPIAYELDVYSGSMREVARARHRGGSFVTDLRGNVAFTHGRAGENDIDVFYRSEPGAEFQRLPARVSKNMPKPVSPAGESEFYTLLRRNGLTDRLVRWNPASGEASPLFEHPGLGEGVLHMDPAKVIYAVEYQDAGTRFAYLDSAHPMAAMHSGLSAAFPDDVVRFTSTTDDTKLAVAYVSGGRNPGVYYLVDLKENTLSELLRGYPWLQAESLASTKVVQIPSRGDRIISGHLTIPVTPTPEVLAAVVLIDDGSQAVGFDWRAQLISAKGYAVLRLSLPGYSGRREFDAEAYRRWGLAASGAVVDATRWLIDQDIAQRGRICTCGTGYGGFVALNATLLQPRLYRCAIGYGGVYDLVDNVTEIRAEVMLAYADGDVQAHRMLRALGRAGKSVNRWIIEPAEDNRVGLYHSLISFLDEHIYPEHPPRTEDEGWDGGQEIVCEKIAEAGTRVKRRICRTRQHMEEEKRRARDELNRRQGMQPGGGADN